MIEKPLLHFKTKQAFEQAQSEGLIKPESIVFIQDTGQISTHGEVYGIDRSWAKVETLYINQDSAYDEISEEQLQNNLRVYNEMFSENQRDLNSKRLINLVWVDGAFTPGRTRPALAYYDDAQAEVIILSSNDGNGFVADMYGDGLVLSPESLHSFSYLSTKEQGALLSASGWEEGLTFSIPNGTTTQWYTQLGQDLIRNREEHGDNGARLIQVWHSDTEYGEPAVAYLDYYADSPDYYYIVGLVSNTRYEVEVATGSITSSSNGYILTDRERTRLGIGTSQTLGIVLSNPPSSLNITYANKIKEAGTAIVRIQDSVNKLTKTCTGFACYESNIIHIEILDDLAFGRRYNLNPTTGELTLVSKVENRLVPSGGHERQILSWKADGQAQWEDMSNLFTGLEELLAYGVEWDITVADPHLTRIGNMSLHKTLPIQSQLKGCIAQNDKIIYWLDENDWRGVKGYSFNIEGQTVERPDLSDENRLFFLPTGDFQMDHDDDWYINRNIAIRYVHDSQNHDFFTKIVKVWTGEGQVLFELDFTIDDGITESGESIYASIGSRLDGYDGTVRVYCPSFYIKSKIIGNKRQVWLSTVKVDNTWTYQHEILLDAYRCTVLNTVPENMGYLSTLPVNSAISVVNTATYCRGGGNASTYDQYLETDPCRTGLGKPRTTGLNRATMRQYAKNAGNYIMSYDQYKNIMYWLYVVEYANFNSQEAFNSALTDEGYHQGGMGPGVTNWDWTQWNYYSGNTPITPCGYLNEFGNGSGVKAMTLITPTTSGGEPTREITFQVPRWRGFDNPFGDIWTNLDGIIIDADADNHPNNMNYVYTCKDPDKFGETLTEDWEKIGEEIHQDGYTKLFDLGDAAHIIPKVMGGNTTTYKCDYHWTGVKNATLRALFVGGGADHGANAGLGRFDSIHAVSASWATVGFRSVSRFVSFSSQE